MLAWMNSKMPVFDFLLFMAPFLFAGIHDVTAVRIAVHRERDPHFHRSRHFAGLLPKPSESREIYDVQL